MQTIFERLNMDVRRLHIQRTVDNLVNQANNRRFAGQVFQMLNKIVIALTTKVIIE